MDWTCEPVDRSGSSQYLHVIRADNDPKRSKRPKGGYSDKTPHHTFNKMDVRDLELAIFEHLSDGVPRTFNRICVELWDKNANTLLLTKADKALWGLVEGAVLEHTIEVPVLFRVRKQSPVAQCEEYEN